MPINMELERGICEGPVQPIVREWLVGMDRLRRVLISICVTIQWNIELRLVRTPNMKDDLIKTNILGYGEIHKTALFCIRSQLFVGFNICRTNHFSIW